MTQDYKHPIAPPPQWRMDGWQASIETMGADVPSILLEVIQWGREQAETDIERKLQKAADQELEACIDWMKRMGYWGDDAKAIPALRAARRPKPPSLKEQALIHFESYAATFETAGGDSDLIFKALKSIPDPS